MDTGTKFGKWWKCEVPFRHYRATNVLGDEDYANISSAFISVLAGRLEMNGVRYRMSQSVSNYDAYVLGINEELASCFQPFFSERFISLLYRFLDIPPIGRVDGALHSSPKNSRTGWVHTDFCSAWFDESSLPEPGTLVFPKRKRCDYFTGKVHVPGCLPREYTRAAALIFYLCNDGWITGDGGETGLYDSQKQSAHSVVARVEPQNNSLLLFECTPNSYHRFLNNPGRPRNSIILWIHSTLDFSISRWGNAINRRSA